MGTFSWTLSVHPSGAPAISASSATAQLEGFDQVQVVVEPGATDMEVNIQPGPADRVALLLVSSTVYGPGLTFTVFKGNNKGATVALTQPQVFAAGAVALLGAAPQIFKFTSTLLDPATVSVYVFRDATA